MTNQVNRRTVARWLLDHGFEEAPTHSGVRRFKRKGSGTVSVTGHGPTDIAKERVGILLRALAAMGFDSTATRAELTTGRWTKPQ